MNQRRKGGAIMAGIFLIALGVLWVLNNTGAIHIELRAWWPLIIIAIGLSHLGNRRNLLDFGSWLFIGIGVVFLLTENNILDRNEVWKYWPVALILVGLNIVLKGSGYNRRHQCCPTNTNNSTQNGTIMVDKNKWASDEDHIQESIVFSGLEKRITSTQFKGGSISATFAGAEVDFTPAKLAPDGAYLELTALFGGVEIRIPESWSVEIRSTAIMGAVDQKCANPVKQSGPRLIIKANATFGGVEIKN